MNTELECPWVTPTKVKGENMIYPGTPRDEDFHRILKEQAAEETLRWGKTISPETMLINFALYPTTYKRLVGRRMLDRYKQLKKEKRHAKKSIDGIIRRA